MKSSLLKKVILLTSIISANAFSTELFCKLDEKTPKEFKEHISNATSLIIVEVANGSIKKFSIEKIKQSTRHSLYYEINFVNGGSSYIDRESLDLIYYTESMERTKKLGTYYGNSREPGADYKCRILNQKI